MFYENYDLDSIVTPVNPDMLRRLLTVTEYDKQETQFLVEGFTHGFPLCYQGSTNRTTTSNNLKFRVGDKWDLWRKVMTEVKEKRFNGPWEHPPYTNFIQSPLGLVPKSGGKTRLIYHLSWPPEDSVNANIPQEFCTTQYPSFQEAIQMLMEIAPEGPLFIGKVDCKNAFRVIPFHPSAFQWLIMKAQHPVTGKEYFFGEKCLSFGSSISCSHYQRFSNSLAHIFTHWEQASKELGKCMGSFSLNQELGQHIELKKEVSDKTGGGRIHNYLDDFLTGVTSVGRGNQFIKRFIIICGALGVPLAEEKVEWCEPIQVFLGLLINTLTRTISIPLEKREKAMQEIDLFIRSKKVTVHQIQKLGGRLNFLCRAIFPGRAFTRRIQNKANGLKQHYHVRVDREMGYDLKVWEKFLTMEESVCRPFVDFSKCLISEKIECSSDASGQIGFGCRWGRFWAHGLWDQHLLQAVEMSIQFQELYALAVMVELFAPRLTNRRVTVLCDNQAVCAMVNNSTSSSRECMFLIRLITLTSMQHNVRFFTEYIESLKNQCSDALSRNQIKKFKLIAGVGNINPEPENLPETLWPINPEWWN